MPLGYKPCKEEDGLLHAVRTNEDITLCGQAVVDDSPHESYAGVCATCAAAAYAVLTAEAGEAGPG